MTLIKIIPESIKPNPKAGQTVSMMQGPRTATFSFPNGGKIPADLLTFVEITEWRDAEDPKDGVHVAGHIIDPDTFERFIYIPGIELRYDAGLQEVRHFPEPSWLFEYENPPVPCSNCGGTPLESEIETDYDDDGNRFTTCPICEAVNTFEIEYQSLTEALANRK